MQKFWSHGMWAPRARISKEVVMQAVTYSLNWKEGPEKISGLVAWQAILK
jgi:hypothetical protein